MRFRYPYVLRNHHFTHWESGPLFTLTTCPRHPRAVVEAKWFNNLQTKMDRLRITLDRNCRYCKYSCKICGLQSMQPLDIIKHVHDEHVISIINSNVVGNPTQHSQGNQSGAPEQSIPGPSSSSNSSHAENIIPHGNISPRQTGRGQENNANGNMLIVVFCFI